MGYVKQRRVYKLIFADPEMNGLEVRAKSMTIADFMEFTDTLNKPRGRERFLELLDKFASVLIDWNLEEEFPNPDVEGCPVEIRSVPPTREGLISLEEEFVTQIILAWMDAIAGVSPPLAKPSSSGQQSEELSTLKMEPLSPSLAS